MSDAIRARRIESISVDDLGITIDKAQAIAQREPELIKQTGSPIGAAVISGHVIGVAFGDGGSTPTEFQVTVQEEQPVPPPPGGIYVGNWVVLAVTAVHSDNIFTASAPFVLEVPLEAGATKEVRLTAAPIEHDWGFAGGATETFTITAGESTQMDVGIAFGFVK
jgi:hypothetical protein